MRKIVAAVVAGTVCLFSGCSMPWERNHCGFHFEILKPPTIDTNTPVLIQNGGQQVTAHPMGTSAGPVTEGQFLHGVPAPMMMPNARPEQRLRLMGPNIASGCEQPRGMSAEEWCKIMNEMNRMRMPAGPSSAGVQ
jgi:hypothetical protein